MLTVDRCGGQPANAAGNAGILQFLGKIQPRIPETPDSLVWPPLISAANQ